MIKRSILWVLTAYCIGIVFRDRLEWMLWAVLFSCAFFACAIWKRKGFAVFVGSCKRLQSLSVNMQWCKNRTKGYQPKGAKEIRWYDQVMHLAYRKKGAVQRFIKSEKHCMVLMMLALLAGAVLGSLQAADYPIDAVLTEKTAATAEGRIRSIAETQSGYRLELNHVVIVLDVPTDEMLDVSTGEILEVTADEMLDVTADEMQSGKVGQSNGKQGSAEVLTQDTARKTGDRQQTEELREQMTYTQGRLLVYCESVEGLEIGNYVQLEGKAVPFAEPENAGQFDERSYYRAERMCCKFNADEITVLNDGVDEIREWCRRIRSRLDSIYEEILPKKHAGIVSAILLGDKAELDADTKSLYQKNGIAHILAISGLHVSLLGMGLFALIRKCGSPLIPAAAATMLILVFYGCLTEFSVSTQRAVGMLVIAMFARILGRTYDSRSACALCGLVILFVNPLQLYQAGFQLSFAAAFGISYFGRELEQMKLNKGKTIGEKLKVSLLSGLTTQLITAPIVLNCFYELPVYSVFLNLPVIGLLSAVVFLSILSGFAGIFSYALGRFLAGGVYVILEFYELLCRLTEKLPCPVWLYGKPQGWRIVAYFAVLCLFFVTAAKIGKTYRHHSHQHRYRRRAFWVLCLLPLVFVKGQDHIEGNAAGELLLKESAMDAEREEHSSEKGNRRKKDGYSSVSFLSVGQGDCAVVRSKSGSTYLIDCGSSSVKSVGEYRLKPWLKYHGIAKLEAVFLSHPDSDHTNGVLELLEKANAPDDWYRGEIQIKNLILPAAYRKEVEENVKEAIREEESAKAGTSLGETDGKRAEAEKVLGEADDKRAESEKGAEGADDKRAESEKGAERADDNQKQVIESAEKGFTSIYMLAQKAGIPVMWFDTGDRVIEEELSFLCLHPRETYSIRDTNDASMVLLLECYDTSVLFAGDVGQNGEEKIRLILDEMFIKESVRESGDMSGEKAAEETQKTVVLKVAHHGSKNSTSEAFLEILQPDVAVISCGKNNSFGHPHEETLERLQTAGCEVVLTPEGGTVTVQICEKGTVVSGYKRENRLMEEKSRTVGRKTKEKSD